MSTSLATFHALSDQDLLREVTRLADREREATACLVASLAVLDQRRLYLAEGYGSMFVYCTEALHLSEAAAYKRITVARAAQRFPVILARLAEGTVSLATVNLLAGHLTLENHVALLDEARHRSKREVEEIVARLQPRPDVPNTVRKLPDPTSPPPAAAVVSTTAACGSPAETAPVERPPSHASTFGRACDTAGSPAVHRPPSPDTPSPEAPAVPTAAPNPPPGTVTPLAPARYKLTVTLSAETYEKLRQAQDLLRHAIPTGDLALLVDRALTALLGEVAKTKLAATDRPRATPSQEHVASLGLAGGTTSARPTARSRRIPAAVKREVWARDGGHCAFISASGRRCRERAWLEFHHVVPYAKGGEASAANIQLRCKRHNGYEAERDFGAWTAMRVRETAPAYGSARVSVRDVLPPDVEHTGAHVTRCDVHQGEHVATTQLAPGRVRYNICATNRRDELFFARGLAHCFAEARYVDDVALVSSFSRRSARDGAALNVHLSSTRPQALQPNGQCLVVLGLNGPAVRTAQHRSVRRRSGSRHPLRPSSGAGAVLQLMASPSRRASSIEPFLRAALSAIRSRLLRRRPWEWR